MYLLTYLFIYLFIYLSIYLFIFVDNIKLIIGLDGVVIAMDIRFSR